MPFSKNIPKLELTLPSSVRKDPFWKEASRLLWWALSIAILLALISYAPTDPSLSTWSSRTHFKNWMGRAGSIVSDFLIQLLGIGALALPLLFLLLGLRKDQQEKRFRIWVENLLFLVSLSMFLQSVLPWGWALWRLKNSGGIVGSLMFDGLHYATGKGGAVFLSTVLLMVSTILVFHWGMLDDLAKSLRKLRQWMPPFLRHIWDRGLDLLDRYLASPSSDIRKKSTGDFEKLEPKDPDSLPEETECHSPQIEFSESGERSDFFPWKTGKRKRVTRPPTGEFALPSVTLLSGKAESKTKREDKSWFLDKGAILIEKLKNFGVEGEVANISPGPVITVYEFKPASGVKIKEIANLSDDLTLALSVLSVRIVAPIPGKPVVGIEIPSPHREMVFFKDMIQETNFYKQDLKIPVVMGRLPSGEPVITDLAAMPHLLIAGTTGTGKSVFINTLINSLLFRFAPTELKLILVDPKMVELSHYEDIPHLLLPVVVDSKKAALALRWTVDEMERRYAMMHQSGVRHIDGYNERLAGLKRQTNVEGEFLPYIVVVIDEYADLMAVVPKDVELSIARLAQKARASGIHLVLATQRPSTDVVTGTIKANFPSRISFRVASSVDSKTILDRAGAERLLGNGDMLLHSAGFTTLKRMQAPFLSDTDIENVVAYLKTQGEPQYDERILQEKERDDEPVDLGEPRDNELYDMAVRLVTEKGEASTSLIQRHLRIGYNRAATLMEELEKNGVVGESLGPAKRRAVLGY